MNNRTHQSFSSRAKLRNEVALQNIEALSRTITQRVHTGTVTAIRKVFADAEIAAQHGPVRVLVKNGKPVTNG